MRLMLSRETWNIIAQNAYIHPAIAQGGETHAGCVNHGFPA